MAVAKTMPRYTTGSDRQVQWAAAASPTIPAGRAGAADHRKPRTTAASDGQLIAQVSTPFPSVRPSRPITWIVSRTEEVTSGSVRVTTVAHGHHWSPTVANGSEKPEVVGPLAHATAMLQAGDSDCGPEGRVGGGQAADGQQPVSVTTGELPWKPWRIMTADTAINGH